jgi:AcrR family transcriptional regulator
MPRSSAPPALESSARERLLAAALALFNAKGFAATTVREIVEEAGVTKPVLYYHFKNKEGIYLHLMNEGFAEFTAVLERSLAARVSAADRLQRLLVRTYRLFLDHIAVARLMYAIYYGPPQGAPHFDFDRVHDSFREAVRGLLRQGVQSGEFRACNTDDVAWVVIGVLSVATELHLCHPERPMSRQTLARMLEVVLGGIRKPQLSGKKKRSSR